MDLSEYTIIAKLGGSIDLTGLSHSDIDQIITHLENNKILKGLAFLKGFPDKKSPQTQLGIKGIVQFNIKYKDVTYKIIPGRTYLIDLI